MEVELGEKVSTVDGIGVVVEIKIQYDKSSICYENQRIVVWFETMGDPSLPYAIEYESSEINTWQRV